MLELGCLRGDRCGLFAALQRRMEQVGEVPVRQQFEVGPQGPGSLIDERHAGARPARIPETLALERP